MMILGVIVKASHLIDSIIYQHQIVSAPKVRIFYHSLCSFIRFGRNLYCILLNCSNNSLPNFNFRYIKFRRNKPQNIQQSKPTNRPRPCLTLRFDRICIFDNHGGIHIISCQVKMNIFSNIFCHSYNNIN